MNREEFKLRMKSLKSYRELNPDKGYWDWRNSLPDNLKYTNDLEYDMKGAYESGAQLMLGEDGFYHLPSRDPESGKILKSSTHPTYWKALTEDDKIGYKTYFVGRDTYTWNDEDGPFIPWLKAELFEEGGEVPLDNSPARVNPITNRPLANGALTPVLGLEGAANFTPVGDILSIRDAYIAAKNKDLLGLGLAGLGILPLVPRLGRARAAKRTLDSPTIPTVDKDYFLRQFEEMEKRDAKRHQVADDFYRQRNEVLESLIENEDVFRRSANSDRLYGTNYKRVYEEAIKTYDKDKSPYNDDLPLMAFDHRLYKTDIKGQVDPKLLHRITINPRYSDLDELDDGFLRINEGLVRHEMGHITDEKAGKGLVDRLADPTKFVDEALLQEMYPRTYRSFSKNILRRGSEIKSYMNEFRDFLAHQGIYSSKETVNSFRKKLDLYGDLFKVLRRIFDSYKNKRDFIKDYNTIPILGTGAIGINYYFNQLEEE